MSPRPALPASTAKELVMTNWAFLDITILYVILTLDDVAVMAGNVSKVGVESKPS